MKRQTPLAVEEEPQEVPIAGDAWALDVDCRDHTVMARDSLRARLEAQTAAFLHNGGKISQIAIGVSSQRLECHTVHYTSTHNGESKTAHYTAFVDRDMSRRALDKRGYKHLSETAAQLVKVGFDAEAIARVCGANVAQVERVLKDLGERTSQ